MFTTKYKITILNNSWEVIKDQVDVKFIPRRDEYLFFDKKYYEVLNVVHVLDGERKVLVVIQELPDKLQIKAIEIK